MRLKRIVINIRKKKISLTYNKQETKSTLITRIQTYYIINKNTTSNMDKKPEAKFASKKIELSTNACTTTNPLVKVDKKLLETKKKTNSSS